MSAVQSWLLLAIACAWLLLLLRTADLARRRGGELDLGFLRGGLGKCADLALGLVPALAAVGPCCANPDFCF